MIPAAQRPSAPFVGSERGNGRGDAAAPKGASCNTHPLNTQTPTDKGSIPENNQIVIDWLEFTLPDDFRIRERFRSLEHYLKTPGASFRDAPRGMHGYKKQIIYGKARILMDGSEGMGVHVILSGEALREMKNNPLDVLHWVLHHGGKVGRIDLALDNVTGELTLARINRAVRSGAVTCRAKTYRRMESGLISTGHVTGETLYFGSAKSDTQYRIYDKAAEQGLQGHWVRCEGQYRHENAQRVAQLIHDARFDVGSVYCGLLCGYLNVLSPSRTDTNKSRWKTAQWWLDLLAGAEKLKLAVPKKPPTLERSRRWLKKQVAPTIAMILDGFGSDAMMEIYLHGKARMTPEQRQLCAIPF
ncbi:replication initiation factor domain-containing protein [Desulfuromonas thiophila]|uniref:Phage replication initiation protein n=1 Tax=Desulfuromonas thiophila TaxID=57664 RepID=A0A1G7ECR8_9BACT|nr:replication initiation factor domain-containing protein [Desulfuromonas thiophila]SDE61402.1 phage replication initiation protein [Desulfuromonas thiophila]